MTLSEYDLNAATMPPGELALYYMNAARYGIENRRRDMATAGVAAPLLQWPSTIPYLETHLGGLYGMTSVIGEEGAGKSTLLMGSMMEAAGTGEWQTVLFIAEDDAEGFEQRFFAYLDEHPHVGPNLEHFHLIEVGTQCGPEEICNSICGEIDLFETGKPVLVGLDSVQSIVNLSGGDFYQGLHELSLWAMLARRLSRGRASFIISSEKNYKGGSKGVNLGYLSDVVIAMKAETPDGLVVSMECKKSRRSGGRGPMGKYERNVRGACFEPDVTAGKPFSVIAGGRGPREEVG